MSVTTAKPSKVNALDLKQAQEQMRIYAQSQLNLKALHDRIKNEADVYKANMKAAEEALLTFGKANRKHFDADGNFQLEDGYLHAASNTVIVTSRKFDMAEFMDQFPEFVDCKFKVAPIKKAILKKDDREILKSYGVSTDTEETLQVIATKPEA